MSSTLLWLLGLATGCDASNPFEEKTLVDEIYEKHLTGDDFVSLEERRELKGRAEFSNRDDFGRIDHFAEFLSDDELSSQEKGVLMELGVSQSELDKYNWHHAWTRTNFAPALASQDDTRQTRLIEKLLTMWIWNNSLGMSNSP